MSKEEILRMIRESVKDHSEYYAECGEPEGEDLEVFVRFAELVAQHEREACAKLVEITATKNYWRGVNALVSGCIDAIRSQHE